MMKKTVILLFLLCTVFSCFALTGCDLLSDIVGGDSDTVHTSAYEPITGRFYLYEAADKRATYTDTYFDIDGTKGSFTLRYYENGVLKKEGKLQRIVTHEDRIGSWSDNLHLNIKCGDTYEHISTYTESFDPINQFRILDEYSGGTYRKE